MTPRHNTNSLENENVLFDKLKTILENTCSNDLEECYFTVVAF